jgi:hypothetical protein
MEESHCRLQFETRIDSFFLVGYLFALLGLAYTAWLYFKVKSGY